MAEGSGVIASPINGHALTEFAEEKLAIYGNFGVQRRDVVWVRVCECAYV